MSTWLLLHPNGMATLQPYTKTPSLAVLQAAVGGMVEHAALGHGCALWCNENGLAEGLPYNALASVAASRISGWSFDLVGPVLLEVRGQRGRRK